MFVGAQPAEDGLRLLGSALPIAAGIVTLILSRSMPARTLPGAMIRAMLAAYRRTLEKTMEQARSMDQVVERPASRWLETPDQAVVWGVALGLQTAVEDVLRRTTEDVQSGVAPLGYLPAWYGSRRAATAAAGGVGRLGGGPLELLADPELRRDDVGLARSGTRRSSGRVAAAGSVAAARWWRRRRGRRLLSPGKPRALHSSHGCNRHDGGLLRTPERR